jgi:hypothetical protein
MKPIVHSPDALTSVYFLVYILHTRKRYEDALELYQRACHIRR